MKVFLIALVVSIIVYIISNVVSYLALLGRTTNMDGNMEAAMISTYFIGPICGIVAFVATTILSGRDERPCTLTT